MWNWNIKAINIMSGANDFQHLVWVFWVCQLYTVWYNSACSQLISQFDHHQHQLAYPTVAYCPVRNLQLKTLQTAFHTFHQSQHLPTHCTHLFLHFSCVFTFLEIIKHMMPRMLLFFIFNIKIAIQKFTNFDVFLKACWCDSSHNNFNLIKLFQKKLDN